MCSREAIKPRIIYGKPAIGNERAKRKGPLAKRQSLPLEDLGNWCFDLTLGRVKGTADPETDTIELQISIDEFCVVKVTSIKESK